MALLFTLIALLAVLVVYVCRDRPSPGDKAWERFNKPDLNGKHEIKVPPPPPIARLDSARIVKAVRDQKLDPEHDAKVLRLKVKRSKKPRIH